MNIPVRYGLKMDTFLVKTNHILFLYPNQTRNIFFLNWPYNDVELQIKQMKSALVYTEIYNNPLSGIYFTKTLTHNSLKFYETWCLSISYLYVLFSCTVYLHLKLCNNDTLITVVILYLTLYNYGKSLEVWGQPAVWSVLWFYTNIYLSVSCIWEAPDMKFSQTLDILMFFIICLSPMSKCQCLRFSQLWLYEVTLFWFVVL
jgi:hypothetical protein